MIAIDTNVLIYACDRSDPNKQQRAMDLVANSDGAVLLWQVAWEFVAASGKLAVQGFTPSDAWNRLTEFIDVMELILPSTGALHRARELHLSKGISFRDAMISAPV
jgi:predicted nucleic acid-binding protein